MKFFRRAPKDPSPEEMEAEAARTLEDDPEMGLLADFVTGQLDDAGNEAVLERLETDEEFRELAEPVLFAVSLTPEEGDKWGDLRRELDLPPLRHGVPVSDIEAEIVRDYGARFRANLALRFWRTRARVALAAALCAAIIAFVAISMLINRGRAPIGYATPANESITIGLADGSNVQLGGGSVLSQAAGPSTAQIRTRQLDGEATFTVAQRGGAGFVVRTRTATITTTGAVFTLRCFPNDTATLVTVAGGTVVAHPGHEASGVILQPGQRAMIAVHSATGLPRAVSRP